MSCDEIRYWLRELMARGWSCSALTRVLGASNDGSLISKLKRSWIYPSEQIRFTRQLDRILSGELVQARCGKWGRLEGVLADNPVPIRRPARMVYDLKTGKVGYVAPRPTIVPMLPSFRDALEKAEIWQS